MCDVSCGVGNLLYNKGAIGAFIKIRGTTFLFINAHLAAHQHRWEDRNEDVDRIMTEFQVRWW